MIERFFSLISFSDNHQVEKLFFYCLLYAKYHHPGYNFPI